MLHVACTSLLLEVVVLAHRGSSVYAAHCSLSPVRSKAQVAMIKTQSCSLAIFQSNTLKINVSFISAVYARLGVFFAQNLLQFGVEAYFIESEWLD